MQSILYSQKCRKTFIAYELDTCTRGLYVYFKLGDCFLGAVRLTKIANIDT